MVPGRTASANMVDCRLALKPPAAMGTHGDTIGRAGSGHLGVPTCVPPGTHQALGVRLAITPDTASDIRITAAHNTGAMV